jgi:hypothetical protein
MVRFRYEVFNADEHEVKEDCSEYNITSDSSCKEYCADIDPAAFNVESSGGDVTYCDCGNDERQICGSGAAFFFLDSSWWSCSLIVSLLVAQIILH